MSPDDRVLDYAGVSAELAAIGFTGPKGKPLTYHQVRRMHEKKTLPFFVAPGRRVLIMRSVLLATVDGWQNSARRELREARDAERPVRRKRRA